MLRQIHKEFIEMIENLRIEVMNFTTMKSFLVLRDRPQFFRLVKSRDQLTRGTSSPTICRHTIVTVTKLLFSRYI